MRARISSRSLWSAAMPPRSPLPEKSKSGPVPANNGVRLHDDQDIRPVGPDAAQSRPEEPIPVIQPRPWPFPMKHGELLPESEDFQCGVNPTTEEDPDYRWSGRARMTAGKNCTLQHSLEPSQRANSSRPQLVDFGASQGFVYTQPRLVRTGEATLDGISKPSFQTVRGKSRNWCPEFPTVP